MWLVALACLVVAIGIVWWSMPEQGISITIHFPEGHGLKSEDYVRFRGIDVGIVDEVKLNRELSGVDVDVNLLPFATPLAREGTRFWIVRPELSLGRISGLETAVGDKYIGLIPGEADGEGKLVFEGLASAPADAIENRGIEILVRGERRSSVTAGSPVNYRGVIVGRVLSVGLSPDGLNVDARLRIFDKFTRLVTSETKFWANSGLDASFSVGGGVKIEMESLETLVQGGVSMLTIQSGGRPAKPGDDFVLHSSPGKDWYERAGRVQTTSIKTRGALPLEMTWRQKGLLGIGTSNRQVGFVGTNVGINGQNFALVPSDMLIAPEKAFDSTLMFGLRGFPNARVAVTDEMRSDSSLTRILLPSLGRFSYPTPLMKSETRVPTQAESCVAIRANGQLNDLRFLPLRIDAEDIGENWILKNFDGDRSVWHGAPVMSEADGKMIGVLLVGNRESRIEMVDADQFR